MKDKRLGYIILGGLIAAILISRKRAIAAEVPEEVLGPEFYEKMKVHKEKMAALQEKLKALKRRLKEELPPEGFYFAEIKSLSGINGNKLGFR